MPKAELHIHLEGAFRWSSVRELHPDGRALPESPPWLEKGGRFGDFSDFRDVFFEYIRPSTGTAELVERHTREALLDLARQNVRYAEIIIGPQFHMARGLALEDILGAFSRGKDAADAEAPIHARFLFGLQRHAPRSEVFSMLREVVRIAGPDGSGLVSGVDLQGDERVAPAEEFKELFDFARKSGLRTRAHAGELAGPESVRSAIDVLEVRHISHGVRAIEDPGLVERIADSGAFLHTCPTSNLLLGIVRSLEEHPLRALHDAGCLVTVNSDDPLLFGATITDEYRLVVERLGFDLRELARLAKNAFAASMLPDHERLAFMDEIDQLLASSDPST